jgi:adenosine deaminase
MESTPATGDVSWNSLQSLRELKKAELHAHLAGCIPTEAAGEIVCEFVPELPAGFDLERDLSIAKPVPSLWEYFTPWRALGLLPRGRACLARMFGAALDALARDGVVYAELRHSPFKVARLNDLPFAVALQWAIEGLDAAIKSTVSIDPRLILSIDRAHVDIGQVRAVLDAFEALGRPRQIVGIDVAGDETFAIGDGLARLLRRASEELGLGITIHAGEVGPPEHIRHAVEACGATRVGHGLSAARSPPVLEMLSKRDICLELCLRSNLLTSCVSTLQAHPIFTFISFDIPFVLCTDNPGIHNFSLSQEYLQFYELTGRADILELMFSRQAKYCFGDIRPLAG